MVLPSDDLDKVNDDMVSALLPVVIVICIYMVVGLLGNPLVVYYYGCRVNPSPSYNFIVAMAIFDIIICSVSMPLEIVDMRFPYKFPSASACKILRFVNYFASISSGLILIAIASDRYRKVCQPFKYQITTKMTNIIIGIICLFSLSVSWPAFVFYDILAVNITSSEVTGYDCTTIRKDEYRIYITLYNGVCFLIFIGCITSLTILYILIGRKLYQLNRFRFSAITKKSKNINYSPETSLSEIDLQLKRKRHVTNILQPMHGNIPLALINEIKSSSTSRNVQGQIQNQKDKPNSNNVESTEPLMTGILNSGNLQVNAIGYETKRPQTSDLSESTDSETDTKTSQSMPKSRKRSTKTCIIRKQKKIHDKYIHLKKYTLLMLTVSIAFVMTFLPYLGLMTWRTLAPKYERNLLSKSELIAFNIFLRSWLISSVVNPLIYGFLNGDFRSVAFAPLAKLCCCCTFEDRVAKKDTKQESSYPV